MISLNEAIDLVLTAVRPLPAEQVPLLETLGRTVAADVVSPEDVPSFDNSAMDGFAARGTGTERKRSSMRSSAVMPCSSAISVSL